MSASQWIDYSNPNSIGSRLRRRRGKIVLDMIEAVYKQKGECSILDVGGTPNCWRAFPKQELDRMNVRIVLLNLTRYELDEDGGRYESVAGNACDLESYGDQSFDLVHSNSVIEHVGTWSAMSAMARECARVGRSYYVQTPYFWFPVEPHFMCPFLHWLPMSMRSKLAMRVAFGNWPKAESVDAAVRAQTSAVLLDRAMFQALFPSAEIKFEWFAGLPKSLIACKLLDS